MGAERGDRVRGGRRGTRVAGSARRSPGELAADARAAGVRELVATVCGDNPPAVSLLRKVASSMHVSWRGREREIVVGLEA